ncbi:MAG: CDP-alcohol phosphatidyltransferase family protein [Fibrobacterota bacterium]
MIEGLKPLYNNIIRPIAHIAIRLRLHPNVLTFTGVAFFGSAGWYAYIGKWYLSILLATCGAIMDGLDGLIARENNQMSVFGGILDSTCDRLTEILWIAGIAAFYIRTGHQTSIAILLSIAALTGANLVSYVKARVESEGIACNTGLLQRPERIILTAFFLLIGPKAMVWGLGLITVLSYITVIQRLYVAYQETNHSKQIMAHRQKNA